MVYGNLDDWRQGKNKANSKPISRWVGLKKPGQQTDMSIPRCWWSASPTESGDYSVISRDFLWSWVLMPDGGNRVIALYGTSMSGSKLGTTAATSGLSGTSGLAASPGSRAKMYSIVRTHSCQGIHSIRGLCSRQTLACSRRPKETEGQRFLFDLNSILPTIIFTVT
jgi:hypothetical protein